MINWVFSSAKRVRYIDFAYSLILPSTNQKISVIRFLIQIYFYLNLIFNPKLFNINA